MEKVKSVIGRIGGKARLASWITSYLKKYEWMFYREPFVGSAAVYFQLYNEGVFRAIASQGINIPRVVLNDADNRIVNLFKVCRERPDELARAIDLT
jgi:DNA adenine methylase